MNGGYQGVVLTGLVLTGLLGVPNVRHGGMARAEEDLSRQRWERPAADRQLKPEEMQELVRLSDVLIDRNNDVGVRRPAAHRLGEFFAHKYCIPALLAVLRDPTDDAQVRQKCVLALSWIKDKRVVPWLIDTLLDAEPNVALQAEAEIRRLTLHAVPFDRENFSQDPSSEMRRRLHGDWRKWWAANKDNDQPKWGRPPHS